MEEWRKEMESKKFNWNKILSGLITSIGIIFMCLFIGLCFFVPVNRDVKALTKDDILNANINFVTAKTKVRQADNYNLVERKDKNDELFKTFEYSYNKNVESTDFYYTSSTSNKLSNYSSSLGNVYLTSNGQTFNLLEKYDRSPTLGEFIPSYATYYKNTITGSIEEIFYDEADDNDFVLLDNYNSYTKTNANNFSVENFYMGFGTPLADELSTNQTTPINTLEVEGTLYTNDGASHNLILNAPESNPMPGNASQSAYYWNQYFDLTTIRAYAEGYTSGTKINDSNSYYINNPQGRYEITFEFIAYTQDNDGNWTKVSEDPSSYTYVFYLLDSSNYSTTPTIQNATLGYIENNSADEYFYNFTEEFPYLAYDPQKYNLSYSRENKEITETITSNFEIDYYLLTTEEGTSDGTKYPKGTITYTNDSGKIIKRVFVLGYFNENKTLAEYLYLSTTSDSTIGSGAKYSDIMNLLDTKQIDFEYKITQTLNENDSKYTLKKYTTYDYDKRELSIGKNNYDTNISQSEYIRIDGDKYYYSYDGKSSEEILIATINKVVEPTDKYSTTLALNNAKYNNTVILKKLLNYDKIDISLNQVDFTYNFTLDDLGIYKFEYNYNCISADRDSNGKKTFTNNSTTSTNILALKDFSLDYSSKEETSSTINNDLYLNVWGYLDTDNSVTLNDITYTYAPNANTLTRKKSDGSSDSIDFNSSNTANVGIIGNLGGFQVEYNINTDEFGNYYLTIKYNIGSIADEKNTAKYTSQVDSTDYACNFEDTINRTISLYNSLGSNSITDEKWSNIVSLVSYLNSTSAYSTTSYYTTSPNISKDTLHIYGSMSYFSKVVDEETSEKAKLRYSDNRAKVDYTSDITKYINVDNYYSTKNGKTTPDISAFESLSKNGKQGLINVAIENGFDINNLITTDITPVFWKNLSSLIYDGKVSQSYIYRYTNYKITEDGDKKYMSYGLSKTKDLYTKDTYCSGDGLYEIVVFYTYDNYKSLDGSKTFTTPFYQVFTFVIDNSSPSMQIKVQDILDENNNGDTTEYITNLGTNKYTNRNIQISWNIPTYFQNDIYIDIERLTYNNEQTYKASYKQGNVSTLSGTTTYVSTTTKFQTPKDTDTRYFVYIQTNPDNHNVADCNGKYKVTLHYSSRGESTSTQEFIIDKSDISGMKVLPAVQNENGTYSVSETNSYYVAGKQIINYNFTFRYSAKSSGAKIYTYWQKIDLISANSSEYDNVLDIGSEKAITTTFKVNGQNEDSYKYSNQYIYNYNTDNSVAIGNYFTNTASCLYLFSMTDEAGNECRYVIFYDTTTPRYYLDPEPKNDIINDTTELIWGDYKAIKIETPSTFEFDNDKELDNYAKDNTSSILEQVLTYINSATNKTFNNTKIQEIGSNYYMLLPISKVTVNDLTSLKSSESTTTMTFENNAIPDNFYFFPANPISDDGKQINVDSYYNPKLENISGYTFYQAVDSNREKFDRFVYAYANDDSKYYGSIGQGEYSFQIYDGQGNKIDGYVWLTLDKTETYAYGIFDNITSDSPAKATPITGNEGSYALSKLYISSLQSNEEAAIPEYTLTYRFYQLNSSQYENLYNNYNISSVRILTASTEDLPSNLTITDKQTYLELIYSKINSTNNTLSYYIELTNEDGEMSAKHSYPYDLEGESGEPDSSGNPQHVYKTNKSAYEETDGDRTRLFSNMIEPVPDSQVKNNTVTQEGLYIFKRMYTNKNIDLGLDTRIIYYIYYVDRTGIINVTTLNSISEQLLTSRQDFGFVLGSDYSEESLKKYIDSDDIYNAQTTESNSYSNTYNKAKELFSTNKTLVEFNLTADKYNFIAYNNKFQTNIIDNLNTSNMSTEEATSLRNQVDTFLFNDSYYSSKMYKVDLKLAKGNDYIINESTTDTSRIFNTSAMQSWLKGSYSTSETRDNSYYLYLQDSNSNAYNIYLKDQSGYREKDSTGAISDFNKNANQLDITFYIKHTAPIGDSYGKYYGRHDYDEDKTTNNSIPITETTDSNGQKTITYALLEKYLQNGQLEPLSLNYKSDTMNGSNGRYAKLYSTNNESLIFTFDITQDDTQAQIDPNNIQIYRNSDLIFNRVNGKNIGTNFVSESRMTTSMFSNVISGVTKYAIVVFDNNLDTILNDNEEAYKNYRLLDSDKVSNPDLATYYITINYVGNSDNYVQEDKTGKKISYATTTFEVTIDRNKPEYNLTKLMSLDKYVYNTEKSTVTTSNYQTLFKNYKKYYNFTTDTDFDFERSDLETYFFALDYRESSSFVFEQIDDLDSSGGIYVRKVSEANYKFSKTPDDYQSYYEATYLPGNPQFSPSRAVVLDRYSNVKIEDSSIYYYIPYGIMSSIDDTSKTIKVSDICAQSKSDNGDHRFLEAGNFYEIIEQDEAGNYRVYGVYLPDYSNTSLKYEYKKNATSDAITGMLTSATITQDISGVNLAFTGYQTSDYFAKANITINSTNLKETISIYYSPKDETIYVVNSSNVIKDKFTGISRTEFNTRYLEVINKQIDNYNDMLSSKTSKYYSQYGYVLNITIIDRLGFKSSIYENKLIDYEFVYNVAGSVLEPVFKNNANNFNMIIPAMQGTTYISNISTSIYQGGWSPKDPDDSSTRNPFGTDIEKYKKGTTYTLNKGVYRFTITDNFNRVNTYFYEFGTTTQSGGLLSFSNNSVAYTDGYTYTANTATFVYDNSVYDIYIKFVGEVEDMEISDSDNLIIYNNSQHYSSETLRTYGIEVATIDSITTITFYGVSDLTKYHIKTIPASLSSQNGYEWNKEEIYPDEFLVYNHKLAIYTSIQQPIIRNANGNVLDTSKHITLSEDFQVTTAWANGYAPDKQIDFDSKIYLERTYTENNVVKTEKYTNSNSYTITKQGDYTAYVVNALNNKSDIISFSRGDNDIGIYSVSNIKNKISTKLSPSATVGNESYETENENRNLIVFNYFTTIDYFSFKDIANDITIEPSDLVSGEIADLLVIENIEIDRSVSQYLDIQVKSDLNIFAQLTELKVEGTTPYAKFRIYSKDKSDKDYTYRFVKIYFLEYTDYNLAITYVSTVENTNKDNSIYGNSATIKRPDKALYVTFKFQDASNSTNYVAGNTMFVDRYYNGNLIETISYNNIDTTTEAKFTLSQVGLHKFVVRDLAGRIQTFGKDTDETKSANSLQIYLINQILFEVNGDTPINNQIFNDAVTIKIISQLAGETLYNTNNLGIKVTRNNEEIVVPNNSEFTFSEAGSYVVKIDATTIQTDQEVSSTYKFVIVKVDNANKSFNVSKGTGFEIEKVIKIVNNERVEMTEKFKDYDVGENINSGSLIWLTAAVQGNSIFEITLKYYNQTLKDYQRFTFNVWLNNDQPVIISSINNGSSTKETISLNFNPGMIYTQVGNCKILINDKEYIAIDANSGRAVETIQITQKGTYTIKIVSEDGSLISSYKFTKNDPINKTTKIILVCIAIGAVVLVALFLLIRRKGKYR